jgi:hypothetical protein
MVHPWLDQMSCVGENTDCNRIDDIVPSYQSRLQVDMRAWFHGRAVYCFQLSPWPESLRKEEDKKIELVADM